MGFNTISHELRVDTTTPDLTVLSTTTQLQSYPDVTLTIREKKGDDDGAFNDYHCDTMVGSNIVRWHRQANELEARVCATRALGSLICDLIRFELSFLAPARVVGVAIYSGGRSASTSGRNCAPPPQHI
jgi:hypothetical protein